MCMEVFTELQYESLRTMADGVQGVRQTHTGTK